MSEAVFWVWNGWGILFTAVVALWQFLHIYVSAIARSLSPLRNALALFIGIPAIILTFVLSGWIAGVLALIIGPATGVAVAKLVLPKARPNR